MKALIIVDVQLDFCEGGALGVEGGNATAEKITQLLSSKHLYTAIVATRDHHLDPGEHFSDTPDFVDSWPPHCVAGTTGQDIHPLLNHFAFDAVFDKGLYQAAYSGFEGYTADNITLADWLRSQKITEVDIVGIATDYCVKATALDAVKENFKTTVILDLTAAVHPNTITSAVIELKNNGVEIL